MPARRICPECGGPFFIEDLRDAAIEYDRESGGEKYPATEFVNAYARTRQNALRYAKRAGSPGRKKPAKAA